MSVEYARDTLADQEARVRIETELDTSFVVEAAAGTGKTTALVGRMVAALAAGRAQIGEVVAVTFTDAAAGELKLRLRAALETRRLIPGGPEVERARVTAALARLEEARIGTIHAFCTDLLRERPVEARVDPLFEVAPEDVARGLLARVVDRWFEAALADPPEAVRRVVRRCARRRQNDEGGPREALRRATFELAEQRDFATAWREVPFDRDAEIDALLGEMREVGAFAARGSSDDFLVKSLQRIANLVDDIDRRETVAKRDHDGIEVRLLEAVRGRWQKGHWAWKGYARRDTADFPRTQVAARRDALKERLLSFGRAADADLAPKIRGLLFPLVAEYDVQKSAAGMLDFLDLLTKARDLVRGDVAARTELQQRFKLIFVDEFQDTDPLQAEILFLLSAAEPATSDWRKVSVAPGKLFLVGDPKQSIYRFRRADVALYEAAKAIVAASGGAALHLTASFRAVPEIQALVNTAFAGVMRGDTPTQARYVPLSPVRNGIGDQPPIVALPVPKPYGKFGKVTQDAIEASLPDAVAAYVDWLVRESDYRVSEREALVPIEPRHVCLLFRRLRSAFSDVTAPYLRALEARGLAHVLVGASPLADRDEVLGLQNAALAVERPDDELRVYATLRGPYFALSDAQLLAFQAHSGGLHPYRGGHADDASRAALPAALREVAEALAVLRDLHRHRNRRTFADTLARLLQATRAHAGLAVWPTGEQALANVARLLELARRAERRGLTSFRAFAESLEGEGGGGASDAPVFEADAPGVRLMSVHKAKGLEFPVVVLADITCRETSAEPTRIFDATRGLCAMKLCGASPIELTEHGAAEAVREREEAARILYVAATRARDMLVVPAVSDERTDGWTQGLHGALYPSRETARTPLLRDLPGVTTFGDDCVVERPAKARRTEASVAPGVHTSELGGTYEVVWWDPLRLQLERSQAPGLRQQELLQADDGAVRAEQGQRAHAEWLEARGLVRLRASAPSEVVKTVTTLSKEAVVDDALEELVRAVSVESVAIDAARPAGPRFGTLVHALLATVDLESGDSSLRGLAVVQQRLLGATDAERDAAFEAARRALAHPLMVRAAAAARLGRCRREVTVVHALPHGAIVEGVVDAAFRDDDAGEPTWIVVDFKTDRELRAREEIYRRQVGIYARAIIAATGERARGVLLRV